LSNVAMDTSIAKPPRMRGFVLGTSEITEL